MATEKKSYSEKLKDPRWQKRRLDIMNRDSFTCRYCSDTTSTLHVHHIKYVSGLEPWDYPEYFLITICESCHTYEHGNRKECDELMACAFAEAGLSARDVITVSQFIIDLFTEGELKPWLAGIRAEFNARLKAMKEAEQPI
jgi:hypothetical protein